MRVAGVVLFVLSLFSFPALGEEVRTTKDFAYGYVLEVEGEGPAYTLPVPDNVYMTVRKDNLADIGVFNSAGKQVPHAIRQPETRMPPQRDPIDIAFFPLFEDEHTAVGTLSLLVSRSGDGTIIDIDSNTAAVQEEKEPTGYLLDLGDSSGDIRSLDLYWRSGKAHSSSKVTVEHTSDLQRWRTLVAGTTLIDIEYGGNRVEQRTIQFNAPPKRYLKLSWGEQTPSFIIERIAGYPKAKYSTANLKWIQTYNGELSEAKGDLILEFTSRYRLPVQSVKLQFNEPNSIIHAVIQSRIDASSVWRERCNTTFYSLQVNGELLESEPCRFEPSRANQWRLVVRKDGAGITESSQNVTMHLGWESQELTFLARGKGPFILAYGNGAIGIDDTVDHSDMVIHTLNKLEGDTIVQNVVLGKKLELGGEGALRTPPPPKPWKTWLLWVVLLAGVAVMGFMAMRLVKDMKGST